MSNCSKELDPIFADLLKNYEERQLLDEHSDEYKALDKKADLLYASAKAVFYRYNPGYRNRK